jgi:phosphoserine phosphatase
MAGTTLYLVRHGETQWNVEKRMQGRLDSPLTDLGLKQGEWVADALRDVPFDAIYASSSPRALRTAEIVSSDRTIPVIPVDALQEISLGVWEGRLQKELDQAFSNHYHAFWKTPHTFRMNTGETFFAVQERVVAEIQRIVAEHPGQNVLVVSHTVALKLIMAHFADRPLPQLWDSAYSHPGSISIVHTDGKKTDILLESDISHWPESYRKVAASQVKA